MRTKSFFYSAIGIAVLFLAVLLILRSPNGDKPVNKSSKLNRSKIDAALPLQVGQVHHYTQEEPNRENVIKKRKVELRWNDFTPLDWSVDELDDFLNSRSKEISGRQMVSLMGTIFPDPEGSEPRGQRLKPGSIPLREQMRLCMKYLKPEDQHAAFSMFWNRFRDSDSLHEYRSEVLEQMPLGYVRRDAMSAYYANLYKDYSSVKELLASDEFLELKSREVETRVGSCSDYAGAANGVEGSLRNILERGDASAEDIVATVKASNLDEKRKLEMIRTIEKRGAELEIMRNQKNTIKRE